MDTLNQAPARNTPFTQAGGRRPPLLTLGDLLFWFYLYPGRWLARLLPPGLFYGLGWMALPLMQLQARKGRRRGARWLAASTGVSPQRAARVIRESVKLQLYGYLDELVSAERSDAVPTCTGIDGWEHFESALARGKGVILLGGHFGTRAGTMYLNNNGHAILSVHNASLPPQNSGRLGRRLQARYAKLRHRSLPEVVYLQDPECSLKILRRLRTGGAVKIQMDGVAKTKGIECRFLGAPWCAPAGIFEIARVSGCAVVPFVTLRRGRGFRIGFRPELEVASAPSREEFATANLPRFLGAVEKLILDHPEAWILWTHF